ncbi:TetR/AcrR family transcriptional regulator [Jannaschia seohaensis]|uniref:AcrR family transcriptional regulator n=1 Tax=Jannaschia seohaensis TaxID=475081 RepID=A0A2Y9AKE6_9RHOB|nr:TetR/AcrR family transcriptional regulator [Jannaschia seohaensis]PWJ20439.1 AcrR family transcriptional regulator [Jannaschia seohaensis]SSA44526.1 DNA-binding transcriptional regulator, AcrR family [Jannaschia seohaensis]
MARPSGSDAGVTGPRVRDAAERLFAAHGYAAVSMRAIAAEVGIGAGALYHYTPDKQTLLFQLMRAHLEEVIAAWAETDPKGAPADRLDAFARFHIQFHLDRPEAVFIAYMELRALEPDNFAVIETLRRRYEAILRDILAAGVAAGEMQVADVPLAANALIAMLTGVTTWYREGGRLERGEVETLYAQMALGAVGAQKSSAKTF